MAKKQSNTSPKAAPKASKPEAAPKAAKPAPKAAKPEAAPKAAKPAPKAAPKAASQPEAAKPESKPDVIALHLNKTGRLCLGKDAAKRLGGEISAWLDKYIALDIADTIVRIDVSPAVTPVQIKNGGGRPYVSITRQIKPLGFDGSKAFDIEAKPYGSAGFEFDWKAAKPAA